MKGIIGMGKIMIKGTNIFIIIQKTKTHNNKTKLINNISSQILTIAN